MRALRPGQVADRLAYFAGLDGVSPDHSGPDPEQAGAQVGNPFEPHPHRADERVALLLGVLASERCQLYAYALGVDVKPVKVAGRDLDHEVVRHQGAALRDDRGPVVHLALDGARDLNRLQLRFEGTCESPFDHALEPALETLQNSHRSASLRGRTHRCYPRYDSARSRANLTCRSGRVAERQTRTVQVRVPERV